MDASYGRDVYYEESAVSSNAKKGERRYKIMHIVSLVILTVAIVLFFFFVMNMPFAKPSASEATDAANYEEMLAVYDMMKFIALFCLFNSLFLFGVWFVLFKLKARVNISYDYVFVSGELRVSKVININKRKLIARFDCEEIIQIGDVESQSYELLKSDPTNKEIICTPNYEAAEGKFFMYIHINDNGKKLYILECREQMLVNILKFAKRTTLAKDYVMQEKKQK